MFFSKKNNKWILNHRKFTKEELTNVGILEILDSSCFIKSHCICCLQAKNIKQMTIANRLLNLFVKYYNQETYIHSRSFLLVRSLLQINVPSKIIHEIRDYIHTLDTTPDTIREINAFYAQK